jgi:5'-3' exonuclease
MDKLNILAIDFNSLFARNWHASGGAERGEAYQRTVQWVQQARGSYDRVALCCDSGQKSFRVALWPEYKATRPPADAMYVEALRKTQERLRADGCSLFIAPELEGFGGHAEGDDVIGGLCAWASQQGHEVTIASGDKDILQLARDASESQPAIRCLSLTTGAVKTCADVIQDFGVPPHLLPELFALAGDSSDNYKPLPGVGLKKAAELLKLTGGSAVALSDAEVLARVRNVVGDALAAKIEQIDGLRDRLIRAKRVATILDSVPIEFSGLEAEPVREPLTEVPAPAVAPLAERFTAPQRTEKVEKPKQAAIVRAEPVAVDRYRLNPFALEPRNPKDAWDAAVSLFESRLYPQYPNPQAILAVVMEGRTLGLPGPTALKNAYIVSGRVGWSARLLRGLCLKHAQICEYFDIAESTPERATAKVKRIGRPELIVQTTLAEAQKRGLVRGGSKWAQDPLSMCVADVERRGARLVFPDIVAGLWTPEELEAGADERGLELLEAAA